MPGMTVFDLVTKWDATAKASPNKEEQQGNSVSEEERARRVAEYKANAPSGEELDKLHEEAARGECMVIHRGRGFYDIHRSDRSDRSK